MRNPSIPRLALALILACAGSVHARSLVLHAGGISNGAMAARDVRIELASTQVRITAASLRVPGLGLDGRLDWQCTLQDSAGRRQCEGAARLRGDDGVDHVADLTLAAHDHSLVFGLREGERRAVLTIPLAATAHYAFVLDRVPAAWLRAPLAAAWPAGELRTGVVDLDATRAADGRIAAQYAIDALAFTAADGTVAGEGLSARGHVDVAPGGRVVATADLGGGHLQAGALQVELPDTPVTAELDATVASGRWQVARFAWRDAGTLEFEATGELASGDDAPLRGLDVRIVHAQLPRAVERYAQRLLADAGWPQLHARGSVSGTLSTAGGRVARVRLETTALSVADASRGFDVGGVHGALDWSPAGVQPPMQLGWRSAKLAGITLPAASARWQSRDGALHLLGTLALRFPQGRLEFRDGVLRPLAIADGERLATGFVLHDLTLGTVEGAFAVAGLSAHGQARLSDAGGSPRLRLEAGLDGGELLAGSVYVKLPPRAVSTTLDATFAPERWQVAGFDWNDRGTLELSAHGELAPDEPQPLRSLALTVLHADLASALDRYGRSWLATRGYPDLHARGTLSGALDAGPEGVRLFDMAAHDVSVDDGGGRFRIDGLDGSVGWDPARASAPSTLGWRSAQVFAIPFGAARAQLVSDPQRIALAQPLAIGVLGGTLQMEKFSFEPRSPRGQRYAGSFAIVGIEMAQLSAALGWPRFGGNLSGGVPQVEFAGDRITLDGGLDLYVFDGHLGVSGMSLERPFGVAPALGADIHFENIDLEQLTGAFSFGSISGRLVGTIDGLRLVDWTPVAFDAWLRTAGGGRMSYQAVNDLTAIGGGLAGGLQTMALGLFHTFGYRSLGVRCRLAHEVCLMGGIAPVPADAAQHAGTDDGYTIAEGAGLPRLDIVGHHRRVDWPTLVRRLEDATHGQGPVVR